MSTVAEPRPAPSQPAPSPWRTRAHALAGGLRAPSPRLRAALLIAAYAFVVWLLERRVSGHVTPHGYIDELVYGKLAQSFAAGEGYSYQGLDVTAYKTLYPVLISPAWVLFSGARAFEAALAINVAVMTTAIFPAYALCRRVASFWPALLGALAAVVIPSVAWASLLHTESLAYPLAALALLAAVRALERPGWQRTAVAVLAAGLAGVSRTQMLVMLPVFLLAVGLDVGRHGSAWRQRLRAHRPALAVLLALTVVGAALLLAGRASTVLGTYANPFEAGLPVGDVALWALRHISLLAVAFALVPFAALLAHATAPASWRDARTGPLLCVAVAACLVLVLSGSWAAAVISPEIRERYIFYPAPLAIALLLAAPGRLALWRFSLVSALVALYFVPVVPEITAGSEFVEYQLSDAARWYPLLEDLVAPVGDVKAFAVAMAVLGAATALSFRVRLAPVHVALLILPTLAFALTLSGLRQFDLNNVSRSWQATYPEPPDFVERRVDGPVAFVATEGSTKFAGWHFEMWNPSIERWWRTPRAEDLNGFGQDCELELGPNGEMRPSAAWRAASPDPARPCAGRPLARFLLFYDRDWTIEIANGRLIFSEGFTRLYEVPPGEVPLFRRRPENPV